MKPLNAFLLILGILYLLYPKDIIPDSSSFGYIDDLIILLLVLYKASEVSAHMPDNGISHFRKDQEFSGMKKRKTIGTSPYHILGISAKATNEEVHEAYKNLMAQYHPDKVQHLGKELQGVARKKTFEISKAYNDIMDASTESSKT